MIGMEEIPFSLRLRTIPGKGEVGSTGCGGRERVVAAENAQNVEVIVALSPYFRWLMRFGIAMDDGRWAMGDGRLTIDD